MSTVAEHVAALECMLEMRYSKDANVRRHSAFSQEAAMFCEVHLEELAALVEPDALAAARLDVERRYREQLPGMAEQIIQEWADARGKNQGRTNVGWQDDQGHAALARDDAGRAGTPGRPGADFDHQHRGRQAGVEREDGQRDSGRAGLQGGGALPPEVSRIGWRCVWIALRSDWVWHSSRVLRDEAEADRVLAHWREIHGAFSAEQGGQFAFRKQALYGDLPYAEFLPPEQKDGKDEG